MELQLFPNINLRKRIADYETDMVKVAEMARAVAPPPSKRRKHGHAATGAA